MSEQASRGPTRGDRGYVLAFCIFAFTSLVMEPYAFLAVDLAECSDPLGRLWFLYASRWDPIFLEPPLWLRTMCAIDCFVFGPCYLALIYGLVRRRAWIRGLGYPFVAALVYSTFVYFGVEVIAEAERADMMMVFLVNGPYTLIPLMFLRRLARRPLFVESTDA